MRTLNKRWRRHEPIWVLADSDGWNWATVHKVGAVWRLELWELYSPGSGDINGEWKSPASFATLREAKNVGRLLSAIELAKCNNF